MARPGHHRLLIATNLAGATLSHGLRGWVTALRDLRERSGLWAVAGPAPAGGGGAHGESDGTELSLPGAATGGTRLLFESGKVLIPWITWCISALAVARLFYGEGAFRRIAISSAWAMWPLIVLAVPLNLATALITRDEKVMWDIGQVVVWGLMAWQFFQVVKTEHKFETRQA